MPPGLGIVPLTTATDAPNLQSWKEYSDDPLVVPRMRFFPLPAAERSTPMHRTLPFGPAPEPGENSVVGTVPPMALGVSRHTTGAICEIFCPVAPKEMMVLFSSNNCSFGLPDDVPRPIRPVAPVATSFKAQLSNRRYTAVVPVLMLSWRLFPPVPQLNVMPNQ